MKNYIKDIYLLIIFLFAAMACSDNEELIKKDEPGEVIPPVVVEPVTVLDEHFDDKNKYLTSGGQPFPSFFSNGYFERVVSDEVIQGLSLKVFLTQCQLEPDAPGVSVNGTTTSDGRILLDAQYGTFCSPDRRRGTHAAHSAVFAGRNQRTGRRLHSRPDWRRRG